MSLKFVVDMNLSPEWVLFLLGDGWQAVHRSTIGDPRASDTSIMSWATANTHVVFTHDLDFGTTLALTGATAPSVLQIRTQNLLPEAVGHIVLSAVRNYEQELAAGAIVVVELGRSRVRVLPF